MKVELNYKDKICIKYIYPQLWWMFGLLGISAWLLRESKSAVITFILLFCFSYLVGLVTTLGLLVTELELKKLKYLTRVKILVWLRFIFISFILITIIFKAYNFLLIIYLAQSSKLNLIILFINCVSIVLSSVIFGARKEIVELQNLIKE